MPVIVVVIVVVALLLLASAGVELNHLVHAYPGQFLMGTFAVLFIAVAMGTARFQAARRGNAPVRLVRELPPLPKAIAAVPVREAITPASGTVPCERDGCAREVEHGAAWAAEVPGEEDRFFCSERCLTRWDSSRMAPQE